MWRRRRDLRVALGRGEPFLCQRRRVVEMDQIMRDAGMARLAQEDGLEDGGSLELHRVGLVARRGRDIEFDRIEDLRLVVVRIGLRHVFHCFEIGQHAAAMIDLVEVGVERRHRVDEVALTLRLRTDCLAFLDRRQPERQVGDRRRRVRIVEQAERDAPIGDPAFRVGLQHLLEQLLRTRDTRTNAGSAWRGRTAAAQPRCTRCRNEPCQIAGRCLPGRRSVARMRRWPRSRRQRRRMLT